MSNYNFFKLLVGLMATTLGLIAAILGVLASAHTRPEQAVWRQWFRVKWDQLSRSRWSQNPEQVVRWLAGLPPRLRALIIFSGVSPDFFQEGNSERVAHSDDGEALFVPLGATISIAIAGFVILVLTADYGSFQKQPQFGLGEIIASVLLLCLPMIVGAIATHCNLNSILGGLWSAVVFGPFWFLFIYVGIGLGLNRPGGAALYMCVVLPHVILVLSMAFGIASDTQFATETTPIYSERCMLFGVAVACSFCLTQSCLWVGHVVAPHFPVPSTVQMMASNVVFDALALTTTMVILERSISKFPLLNLPIGVVITTVLAGIFGFASLWVGVVNTENALSLIQVSRVFIARSVDGQRWELGPCFWALHTTFIPLLIYFSIVLFCWLGKFVLGASLWFTGKAKDDDINPLALTSRLLALVGALFGTVYYFLNSLARSR